MLTPLRQTIWSLLQMLVCGSAILLLVTDQSPSLLLDDVTIHCGGESGQELTAGT